MQTFEELVYRLLKQPEHHARFVNTLSLLEYLGARKILKSQKSETVSEKLLAHAAEEIRHAQIFKGFALKLSDGRLDTYQDRHLLCGKEARTFFQSVDEIGAVELGTRGAWRNYLLTTLLVEERAVSLYPAYERILKEHDIPNALGSIMRDEDSHLAAIRAELADDIELSPIVLNRLRAREKALFDELLRTIEHELAALNSPVLGYVES